MIIFLSQKSHLSTGYSHRECILEGAKALNQRPVWRQFPNGFRAYRKPACIVSSVISRIYHSVSHSDRSLRGEQHFINTFLFLNWTLFPNTLLEKEFTKIVKQRFMLTSKCPHLIRN